MSRKLVNSIVNRCWTFSSVPDRIKKLIANDHDFLIEVIREKCYEQRIICGKADAHEPYISENPNQEILDNHQVHGRPLSYLLTGLVLGALIPTILVIISLL